MPICRPMLPSMAHSTRCWRRTRFRLPVAQQNTPSNFKRSADDTLRRGGAVSGQNDVDVVYVEAAPEQIQNTLTDLRRSPQMFSAVAVTDLQSSAESKDKLGLLKDKSACVCSK